MKKKPMPLWKIWLIGFIAAGAYLALCTEIDSRASRIEHCAVANCT